MAERDIIKYTNYTKCKFIGSTHSIFDFTIWGDFKTVICEGNLIIDKWLNTDVEVCIKEKDAKVPRGEIQKVTERCQKRAEFIYKRYYC